MKNTSLPETTVKQELKSSLLMASAILILMIVFFNPLNRVNAFPFLGKPLQHRYKLTSLFENPIEWESELPDGTDLDKLSMAVAMHETRNCEIKTNFSIHNNCHGFKWNGRIYKFKSIQSSHDYFKDLWKRKYGRFPDLELAKKYSGNDRAKIWLSNITYFYNQI